MTKVALFPGQGSQFVGMGGRLFDRYRHLVEEAEDALGYSVRSLCREDPGNRLTQTEYTQPALFVVNALAYEARREEGFRPEYAAGHSLGEYSALYAAGVFDFATGVRLVKRRGELMATVRNGAMAAVVGMTPEELRVDLDRYGLSALDLANWNTPTQVVLSGPAGEIEKAAAILEPRVTFFKRLSVSGPFHSRYMRVMEEEFRGFLKGFHFAAPILTVIANWSARPHELGMVVENLTRQLSHPVLWTKTIEWFLALPHVEFEEIGPGNILTGLLRQIQRTSKGG